MINPIWFVSSSRLGKLIKVIRARWMVIVPMYSQIGLSYLASPIVYKAVNVHHVIVAYPGNVCASPKMYPSTAITQMGMSINIAKSETVLRNPIDRAAFVSFCSQTPLLCCSDDVLLSPQLLQYRSSSIDSSGSAAGLRGLSHLSQARVSFNWVLM